MSATWCYRKNGKETGPISSAELKRVADAGYLLPTDLVRTSDMKTWTAASSVKNLFSPSGSQPTAKAAVDNPKPAANKNVSPSKVSTKPAKSTTSAGLPHRVMQGGAIIGQFSADQIRAMVQHNQLGPCDLVSVDVWLPASVFGAASEGPAPQTASPSAQQAKATAATEKQGSNWMSPLMAAGGAMVGAFASSMLQPSNAAGHTDSRQPATGSSEYNWPSAQAGELIDIDGDGTADNLVADINGDGQIEIIDIDDEGDASVSAEDTEQFDAEMEESTNDSEPADEEDDFETEDEDDEEDEGGGFFGGLFGDDEE